MFRIGKSENPYYQRGAIGDTNYMFFGCPDRADGVDELLNKLSNNKVPLSVSLRQILPIPP